MAGLSLGLFALTAIAAFADATNSGLSGARRNVSVGALTVSLTLVAVAGWISYHQREDPGVGMPLFLAGLAGWFILVFAAAAAG